MLEIFYSYLIQRIKTIVHTIQADKVESSLGPNPLCYSCRYLLDTVVYICRYLMDKPRLSPRLLKGIYFPPLLDLSEQFWNQWTKHLNDWVT